MRGKPRRLPRGGCHQILCRAYGLPVEPYPVTTWIDRIVSTCDLAPRARKRALDLARVAVEAEITTGCQRSGVAAACVYEAAQEHPPTIRQIDVATAAETTPVTVRARWQELVDILDQQASTDGHTGIDPRAGA